MPVRAAGVRLQIDGLSAYISGMDRATRANAEFRNSLSNTGGDQSVGRAMVASVTEAERRATAVTRGAAQERVQAARAEAQERGQLARLIATQEIEAEHRATAAFRADLAQRSQAQRTAAPAGGGGLGNLGGAIVGGLATFATIQGARQLFAQAAELDVLRGRAISANTALTLLAGGAGQASKAIAQIQAVAPGSTNSLEATEAAVTILTQKLPSAAASFQDIAKFAAIVPKISPSISDSANALSQLSLFASSNAFARADQLGVTADAVRAKMKALGAEFPALSDAQIKAAATVQLVNERFAGLGDSLAENVTGIKKLGTAFEELKISIATGSIGPVDAFFGSIAKGIANTTALFDNTKTDNLAQQLQEQIAQRETLSQAPLGKATNFLGLSDDKGQIDAFRAILNVQEQIKKGFEAGVPGAEAYLTAVNDIAQAVIAVGSANQSQIEQMQQLQQQYQIAAAGARATAQAQEEQAAAQEKAAAAAAAQNFGDTFGQLDTLLATAGEFTPAQVPGIEGITDALLKLKIEIGTTGTVTEEQAAQIAGLDDVLKRASSGMQFLSTAEGQAAVASGGLNAALATMPGYLDAVGLAQARLAAQTQILNNIQGQLRSTIASNLTGLVSAGTISPGQATGLQAISNNRLQQGVAGLKRSGLSGDALTFATAGLERQITQPFRDIAQIGQDMTADAQSTQKAWGGANKEAQAAAKATLAALQSVPGLFGSSKVTQGDLDKAKSGLPVNFADDFLRRFQDVAENGTKRADFGDKEIEQARQALRNIGTDPAGDVKALFEQIKEAWENSSLFASKDNLGLINKQAAEDNLSLQKKMEDGRKNIAEFFGIAIDDTVAAIGGAGGGGVDQAALQANIAAAVQGMVTAELAKNGFNPDGTLIVKGGAFGTPDILRGTENAGATGITSLSDQLRGTTDGVQASFDNATTTADILRDAMTGTSDAAVIVQKSLEDATSTADVLRQAFADTTEAAGVLATKINDIPPIIWEDHIEEFPSWKEDLIEKFPGWEHWLGPEKAAAPPPADVGATGTSGATTVTIPTPGLAGGASNVPSTRAYLVGERGPELVALQSGSRIYPADTTAGLLNTAGQLGGLMNDVHGAAPTLVQQALTQPGHISNVSNRTSNVTINSNQTTGSLVRDWSILRAQGAV